jgi:hypothetical protein
MTTATLPAPAASATTVHHTEVRTVLAGWLWVCTCGDRQQVCTSKAKARTDGLRHEQTATHVSAGQGVVA